jgi:hypothetical protein
MSRWHWSRMKIGAALFAYMAASAAHAGTSISWQTTWSDALFAQAAREHRFVLLDLHAVRRLNSLSCRPTRAAPTCARAAPGARE